MTCTGCIEDKDSSQSCNDSTRKNGKSSRCKSCKNKYNEQWKKNNPEKSAAHIPSRKKWRLDRVLLEVYYVLSAMLVLVC